MKSTRFLLAAAIALTILCGCTPGATPAPAGASAAATTVDINLTLYAPSSTSYGTAGGFAPVIATVAVGTTLRFLNTDGFAHTSTSLTGSTFPPASPFGNGALQSFGGTLSGGWSSGSLPAGSSSQLLLADAAGTYLFGCFYHYAAPMRGAIVVH